MMTWFGGVQFPEQRPTPMPPTAPPVLRHDLTPPRATATPVAPPPAAPQYRDNATFARQQRDFQPQVMTKYGIGHDPAKYTPPEQPIKHQPYLLGSDGMYLPSQRQVVVTKFDPQIALHEYAHDANRNASWPAPRADSNSAFLQDFQDQWRRGLTSGEVTPRFNVPEMRELYGRLNQPYGGSTFTPDELYAWGSELYAQNRQNLPEYLAPYYDFWMDATRLPSYMPYPIPQTVPTPPMVRPTATPRPGD